MTNYSQARIRIADAEKDPILSSGSAAPYGKVYSEPEIFHQSKPRAISVAMTSVGSDDGSILFAAPLVLQDKIMLITRQRVRMRASVAELTSDQDFALLPVQKLNSFGLGFHYHGGTLLDLASSSSEERLLPNATHLDL